MTPAEAQELDAERQEERARAIRRLRHYLGRSAASGGVKDALSLLCDTPPELMGRADVAACLGVAPQNLHKYGLRDMPQPTTHLSNGKWPVYLAEEIRAYADTKRRT